MQRSKPERASAVDVLPAWRTSSHRGISASRSRMRWVVGSDIRYGGCVLGPRAAGHRQESIHCHGQRGRRRAVAGCRRREHGDGEGADHAQRGERRSARTVEPRLLEPRVGRVGKRAPTGTAAVARPRRGRRIVDADDLVARRRARVDHAGQRERHRGRLHARAVAAGTASVALNVPASRPPHPTTAPPATTTTTAPPATTTTTTTTPPTQTGGGSGNGHRGQWPPWGGSGPVDCSCSNNQSNGHVVQTCP